MGSSAHNLSKGLENSVIELDQKKYGSSESLHTIGGSPKSELMLALVHLSKSLSIDNQDPNAPLSDRLKQCIDALSWAKRHLGPLVARMIKSWNLIASPHLTNLTSATRCWMKRCHAIPRPLPPTSRSAKVILASKHQAIQDTTNKNK